MGLLKFVGYFIVSLVALTFLFGLIKNAFLNAFIISLIIGVMANKGD